MNTAFVDPPRVHGGTWLTVNDDSKITYRIDPGGTTVGFVFLGPVELEVGMSADVIRRCQDLFGKASAELRRAQGLEDVE